MSLHVSELGGAAPAILLVHIAAGSLAALSGAAALYYSKGSGPHRNAGNLFFGSMLVMAATGGYLAYLIHDVSVFGGIFTFYLVGTAWVTVKRGEGRAAGGFEVVALLFALGIAAVEFVFGVEATASPDGRFWNYPPGPYFGLAAICTFAALLDLKVVLRCGISGAPRIARHLWRMCFALAGALASFVGQGLRSVLPLSTPGAKYVLLLALVPLLLMIFWLIRVRLTNWYGKAAAQVPQPRQA